MNTVFFNNPQAAVYLLWKDGKVIYVGQSTDILRRFCSHRVQDCDKIELRLNDGSNLGEIEDGLIQSIKPKHNKTVEAPNLECKICKHAWKSRIENPLCCPNCKSRTWNSVNWSTIRTWNKPTKQQ